MPKVGVEMPQELLEDLDEHVGEERKSVNHSETVRPSVPRRSTSSTRSTPATAA